MTQSLVFTAIGTDTTGVVNKITTLASQFNCNIDDSRMAIMGNEFTLAMLISGNNNAISQVEIRLPALANSLELLTVIKRTKAASNSSPKLLVQIDITAPDKDGLLARITDFFASKNIGLSALQCVTDRQKKTVKIDLSISISNDIDLPVLNTDFSNLCTLLSAQGNILLPTINNIKG